MHHQVLATICVYIVFLDSSCVCFFYLARDLVKNWVHACISHIERKSTLATGAYDEYLMVGWLTLQPLSLNTSNSEARLVESVFQ